MESGSEFFIVYGWMSRDLALRGYELYVYAFLYGYTRSCGSYTGTMDYACQMLGTNRHTWVATVATLEERGLIERVKISTGHGRRYEYRCNPQKCNFSQLRDKDSSAGNSGQMCNSSQFKCENLHNQMCKFSQNNIIDNIYNSRAYPAGARARESEEAAWSDEGAASRMTENIRNGGTFRDDIMRALGTTDVEQVTALAEQFTAGQRATGSSHTSDSDYRSHFLRWATIQVKEQRRQAHVDRKMDERRQRRDMTAFERQQLSDRQHADDFMRRAYERAERERLAELEQHENR